MAKDPLLSEGHGVIRQLDGNQTDSSSPRKRQKISPTNKSSRPTCRQMAAAGPSPIEFFDDESIHGITAR